MRNLKWLIVVVLSIVMFCNVSVSTMAATNTEGVTFAATIDTPNIEVSDQEQTVVVTISTNKEVVYDSYEADVYLPDGFVIAEMKNTLTTFAEDTDYFGNFIAYCTSNTANLTTDNLLTITYTIPANTPAGEYELGVHFYLIGRDICTDIWEEGATVTATLTIKEAAPACDHQNTTYTFEPNNDGTHKVICDTCNSVYFEAYECAHNLTVHDNVYHYYQCQCGYKLEAIKHYDATGDNDHKCDYEYCGYSFTDACVAGEPTYEQSTEANKHKKIVKCADCGTTISETIEGCSGGTATCTEKATCSKCGEKYGDEPAGHSFNSKASGTQASVADCTNAATYYVQCDNCNAVSADKTVAVGEANGHAFNSKASDTQASAADCTNAATYYVQCDNCNAVSADKTVAVGEPNGHGKVDGFLLRSYFNGTHDVICNDCGKATKENVTCTVDETKTTEYELRAADCCSSGLKQVIKYCACQYMISNDTEVVIPATGEHTLVKDEKVATCTSGGYKEYWECNNTTWCYEDADGQNKINDISAWMAEGGDGYIPVDSNNHVGGVSCVYDNITSDGHNKNTVCSDCFETIETVTEAHVVGENGYCACGAWYVVMNFNGGSISPTPPHFGMDQAQWDEIVERQYGGFDADQMIRVVIPNSTYTVPVEQLETVIVKAGYKFNGIAYDKDGTQPCTGKGLTEATTVYIIWACNHDEAVYDYTYTDNGDGTHIVKCACGEIINATEEHTYDATTHECVCKQVEKFTIEFYANGGTFSDGADYRAITSVYGTVYTFPDYYIPTRDNYTLTGWNTKADGTGDDIDLTQYKFTKNVTIYAQWNQNHTCAPSDYVDNGNGTHTVKCSCGETINAAETHTYNATTYKCVCGKVETFKMFVQDIVGSYWNIDVPYGANFMDYIPSDANTDKSYINNSYKIGFEKFIGWSVCYENGEEYTGTTMPAGKLIVNVQEIEFTGWYNADGNWSYSIANELQYGWKQINHADYLENGTGSDWYYLDPATGYRAEGLTRVPYPTVSINGVTYAPNTEDVAYAEDKGNTFIDKDEAWFIFDENGKFQSDVTGKYEGTYATCYAVDGMIPWHYGLAKITNKYYYFVGDTVNGGNKIADGPVWITRTNDVEGLENGACYYFLGGVQAHNLTDIVDGKYYKNGKLMMGAGMVETEDGLIFVRSGGQLALGDYWVTADKANGLVEGGKLYNFGETGILTIDPEKNGIVDGVYYKEGVPYYAGLIEIDGDYYYVKSNGEIAKGEYWITKTNNLKDRGCYMFDEETGAMYGTGVYEVDSELRYYENGQHKIDAGLVKLIDEDGKTYYIYVRSSTGTLAIGEYWPTDVNDLLEPGLYEFDENGRYYPGN